MNTEIAKSQQIIDQLSGFEFEVVEKNVDSVFIKVSTKHFCLTLDNHGDYDVHRCHREKFGFTLVPYGKTYRTMKSVNKWILGKVGTVKKQETAPIATPAPVVEESNETENANEVEAKPQTETMQVTHENGEIVITSQSGEKLAVSTDDTGKLNVKFLGVDEGKKVAKVDYVKVEWTESPLEQDTFKSAKELDDAMESILNSLDCDLPDRCYYKTKVTVYFDDGESWQDRIDYTKSGNLSDSRLVKAFEYYQKRYVAGSEKPEWMSQKQLDYRIDFYANHSII